MHVNSFGWSGCENISVVVKPRPIYNSQNGSNLMGRSARQVYNVVTLGTVLICSVNPPPLWTAGAEGALVVIK